MAKRSAASPTRQATKKRRERRAFVPAATIVNPVEYVAPVTAMPGETAAAFGFGRGPARQARTIGVPMDTDYRYVANDLKKILMTGGALVVLLVVLAFVIH